MDPNTLLWLHVAAHPKLSTPKAKMLLRTYTSQEILHHIQHDPGSIGIKQNDHSWIHLVDQALSWVDQQKDRSLLSVEHPDYPSLLKEIYDPPAVLFVQGDHHVLHTTSLAMVGSRQCSHSGQQHAFDFAKELAQQGLTITSGLALGIDSYAHQGALSAKGKTMAVLGTGLECIYPKSHKKLSLEIQEHGCLLSEFFPKTPPFSYNFPKRNRIISGLSLGTFVIEATLKSGSLITARMSIEQNREVFALPGSIWNPHTKGCHHLIQQGAKLIQGVEDILSELNWNHSIVPTHHDSELKSQPKWLSCIDYTVTSIDQILKRTQLPIHSLLDILLDLELEGWIHAIPGGYIRINKTVN